MDFLDGLLGGASWVPHGYCLSWAPALLALHIVSDSTIALSYYSIPVAIICLILRRRDMALDWIAWLFAIFIMACGTTHAMAIWTIWHPSYLADGFVKLATALVSALAAVAVWQLLPRLIALPSPANLLRVNETLVRQIAERDAAVAALRAETAQRLQMEEMLRQSQKLESIGQLTGGIAHDFNNLLGIIIGNAELLLAAGSSESDRRECAQEILGTALQGAESTRRLLAFARRQPLEPQVVDLNTLLPGQAAMLRRTLGNSIDIRTSLSPTLWPIFADPSQISDAVLNLALNSRDAMPNGGTLTIETSNTSDVEVPAGTGIPRGDYVMVAVVDTGIGMPPDVVERALEPFFTTKPAGSATGLGLSMIYGFVRQSGGYLSISSEVGAGTTVTLYLPRAPADAVATVTQDDATDYRVGGNETILLVDDNPTLLATTKRSLTSLGYRVDTAFNGRSALAILQAGARFDLLFTDIVMPGRMSGYELASAARQVQPGLKVLFTTGYAETLAARDGVTAEHQHLLRKPFRQDALAKAVRTVLDGRT